MSTAVKGWVGQVLADGHYEITARLGEGGMGLVYLARDRNLDCDVVVKVPHAAMFQDPGFAGRFAREVRALVRLKRTHIVRILYVGEHEGLPFAVMEYLPGGSLRSPQPGPDGHPAPRSFREVPHWLPAIAEALDFIHVQGYVHRDVKPDNILFDEHGDVYLSDFGIMKALVDSFSGGQQTMYTATGMLVGTPRYMAPELHRGKPYDGRVDQYALAVTVYEMLSGHVPFDGPTPTAICEKQRKPPLPLDALAASVPKPVAEAVQRALAWEQNQRYPTCATFAQAVLNAFGSSPPIPPPADTLVQRLTVTCPGCGQPVRFLAKDQGIRVDCPGCGSEVHLPLPSQRDPNVSQSAGSDTAREQQRNVDTPSRSGGCADARARNDGIAPKPRGRTEPTLVPGSSGNAARGEPAGALNIRQRLISSGRLALAAGLLAVLLLFGLAFALFVWLGGQSRDSVPNPRFGTSVAQEKPPELPPADERKPNHPTRKNESAAKKTDTKSRESPGGKPREEPAPAAKKNETEPAKSETESKKPPAEKSQEVTKSEAPQRSSAKDDMPERPAPPSAVAPFDTVQAKKHQAAWAQYLGVSLQMTNSIGMTLTLIPPGKFLMGSPTSEEQRSDDETQHRVQITKPFYLGVFEVTQGDFESVMGTNPSSFSRTGIGSYQISGQDTSRFPVESVSWEEAVEFCRKLSSLSGERSLGRVYRLPTEAEWEYACRAGTTTPFHFGWLLNGQDANCDGSRPYGTSVKGPNLERTTTVGLYAANSFGLYDMHGNVWEWCSDWYGDYDASAVADPIGSAGASRWVIRGGSWYDAAADCRSAHRGRYSLSDRGLGLGFRLAAVQSPR